MGAVLDIYWQFYAPGDHFLGRLMAGLDPNKTGVLRPYLPISLLNLIPRKILIFRKQCISCTDRSWSSGVETKRSEPTVLSLFVFASGYLSFVMVAELGHSEARTSAFVRCVF